MSTLAISALILNSGAVRADSSPAEQMLDFFGSTCVAKDGSYTKAALGKALFLAETLEGIKADADCQPLSAAATQATSISEALNVLDKKRSNDQNYAIQEQAVLSQIALSSNSAQIASLQDLLIKINVNKKLSNDSDQAIAAKAMILQTNNLVQQAINNQKCLLKKPGVLAAIGSLVSSVGIAATAVNPAIGLGATAGGNMMSNLVNLINQGHLAKQIRRIKDQTLMPEALSCVMESLSNDYCRANDAIAALDWKQDHQSLGTYPINSAAYALTLVDREIPSLANWLTSLRLAAKSQNIYDASQVSDFNAREALYFSSPSLASGVIESTNINSNDNVDKKWAVLQRAVNTLVGILSGNTGQFGETSSKNPLFQIYTNEQAKFFLIGFSVGNIPTNPLGGGPIDFSRYNPNALTTPKPSLPDSGAINYDLKFLTERFNLWFADAQSLLNAERARVLRQDPQLILEGATRKEQDSTRIVPEEAIKNLISFLTAQLNQNPNESEALYLIPDTLLKLNGILLKLQEIHSPSWGMRSKEDYYEILGNIFKAAELGSGVVFLIDRLKAHADAALVRYLTQKPTPADQSVLAQTLASNKMTEILLITNAGKDPGDIRYDISNSIGITLPSLDNFILNYQYSIRDVLYNLIDLENEYGSKVGKTFYDKRARMCLLLTQAKQWPDSIPFSLCEGTSLSLLKSGPKTPGLRSNVLNQSLENRSCKLYNLKRDTLIYSTRTLFSK